MSKFKQLINPHSHSDGSLDGAASISDIIDRNKELGATHVASTEHGNMNTAMDLYHTCQEKNVKPILGIELYLQSPFLDVHRKKYEEKYKDIKPLDRKEEKIEKALSKEYVHLTVHFKDEKAYLYFCNLTPIMDARAIVAGGEKKSICTLDELSGISGHITICSSCLVGTVQKWLLPDRVNGEVRPELAVESYNMIREIAGKDNFFVEIFPHGVTHDWVKPERDKIGNVTKQGWFKPKECTPWFPDGDMQKKANKFVYDLAVKNGDRPIISLDSHFAVGRQKIIQDAKLGNGKESWRFHTSYHLYSTDETEGYLKESLGVSDRDIESWVDNSYEFASLFDNFEMKTNKDRWIMSALPENWALLIKQKIDSYGRMDWNSKVMMDRLKHEINILAFNGKINFIPYFLTVEDVAQFCKREGILMTVRGSAGGSLLLYLLGVSAINPLKHNLSFERFITLGRITANTPPDTDMDISNKDRVVEYLEETHGDAVCKLSTDMMLRLKSSIKDAERSLTGSVSKETENMCKKLPFSPQGGDEKKIVFGYEDKVGNHVQGLIETNAFLKKWTETHSDIWEMASEMLGIMRQKSAHACGFVIADKPVQEYMPVMTIKGNKVTGFNPYDVEEAGLIKYDFLGVNTLGDIEIALKSIKERLGITLDPWDLPHDAGVMRAFGEGRTQTVFQFGSATIIPYLKKIKPKNIDDLAAITALGRPGTLDAPYGDGRTLAEVYVARSKGEKIKYIHPSLEPIFRETMGIQLFQEQTLAFFKQIVGYSDEKAEIARRGIGKKKMDILNSCMGDLERVCSSKGWTPKQIKLIQDQIMASANYSFNKSHSVSYAYVAYACMYLKEKFPLDWWKGALSNAAKSELSSSFWQHVKDFTLLPDINKSDVDFKISGDILISPLSIILGVGPKAYRQLEENAPYDSFKDFVHTFFRKRDRETEGLSAVNLGVVYKLIAAGVLDSLFDENMSTSDKLDLFETLKAEVKGDKKDSIKSEYIGMTALGEYMVKKELMPMYSVDLRPLTLSVRKGVQHNMGYWTVPGFPMIANGDQILNLERRAETSGDLDGEYCCVAYVLNEKPLKYHGVKQATKMDVDVGGVFYETILWPEYPNGKIAPSGFKKMPVILTYSGKRARFSLTKVTPLLRKDQLGNYNVI